MCFFFHFFFFFLVPRTPIDAREKKKRKENEEEKQQSGGTRGRDRMRGLRWGEGGIGKLKLLIDLRAARGLVSGRGSGSGGSGGRAF